MKASTPRAVEVVSVTISHNNIKALMRANEIDSQLDLARRMGKSPRQVSRVILGDSQPSLDVAVRMATVLRVPIEDVFRIVVKTKTKPVS